MNENPIISVTNLSKYFGSVQAINNLSLEIYPGRIIGLMGANGGGKSTLIRHLIGLYLPDAGNCTTFGVEAKKLGPEELARIGYVHQEGKLIEWMSIAKLIRYVAAYYPNWNTEIESRYIEEFELDTKARVGKLSPGQRQKLAVLLAIGFQPELLILDEPAAAMDPLARRKFLELLMEIIQVSGRTIIISSHILTDIEKVIDHALIMDKGKMLCDCHVDDLREQYIKLRLTSLNGPIPENLPFDNIIQREQNGSKAIVTLSRNIKSPDELEEIADNINCQMEQLPLPLEDIYQLVIENKQ
ncbi:ABC transporter ATP-binding protein [Thermodesulfobacteriota bacterium]